VWLETRPHDPNLRLRVENRFVRGMAQTSQMLLGIASLLWDPASPFTLQARLYPQDRSKNPVDVGLCKLIATNRHVFGHRAADCPFDVIDPVTLGPHRVPAGQALLRLSYKAARVEVCPTGVSEKKC